MNRRLTLRRQELSFGANSGIQRISKLSLEEERLGIVLQDVCAHSRVEKYVFYVFDKISKIR